MKDYNENELSQKVRKMFEEGYRCSEAILQVYGESFGLNKSLATRMGCALGGGFGSTGDSCGAVVAAILIIGLKYGRTEKDDEKGRDITNEKVAEYLDKFRSNHGTITCFKLLEDQNIGEREALKRPCSRLVEETAELLEKFLV